MKLNRERLDEIRTCIRIESDSLEFCKIKTKFKDGSYYIGIDEKIAVFGAENKAGDSDVKRVYPESFLRDVKGVELKARVFLGHHEGKEKYSFFESYKDFAKAVGISELVAVSTKLPKIIAKRLQYFSNIEDMSKSAKLRELVYAYIEDCFKNRADSLIFKDSF